jgi:hypothetical protein
VYVKRNNKKLGIVKLIAYDEAFKGNLLQTVIFGIKGDGFLRVSCFCKDCDDIPVYYGECGQKVKEAFGIAISQ